MKNNLFYWERLQCTMFGIRTFFNLTKCKIVQTNWTQDNLLTTILTKIALFSVLYKVRMKRGCLKSNSGVLKIVSLYYAR